MGIENEKPWYETEKVPEEALAAFRSYKRHTDEELVEMIDKRLDPNSSANWIFPTARGSSRRCLEIILFFQHSMELKELTIRNRQLDRKKSFEEFYGSLPDGDIPRIYQEFLGKLSSAKFNISGLEEPQTPKEMREYMVTVQGVLAESKIYKGPLPL